MNGENIMNDIYDISKNVEAQNHLQRKVKVNDHALRIPETANSASTGSLVREQNQNSRLTLKEFPSNEEFARALSSGEAKIDQSFTKEPATFTLFQMPVGIVYAEVRDKESGAVKYYPALSYSVYSSSGMGGEITAKTGTLLERDA